MKATEVGMGLGLGLLALLLSSACGGSRKGAEDASGADERRESGATGTPWRDKTRAQRMDWMGLQVFPKMRAVFVERDAEAYAELSCQTCHGSKMEMNDFKMPNPALFALSKDNPVEEAREYDAEITAFMLEKVVPEMAELLDMSPYDPETKKGFGCLGCHPTEAD